MDEEGSTAQGFVGAVRRFGSWAGDGPIPSSLPLSGARALTRILLRQPTFRNDRRNDRQLGIFNTEGDRDPGFLALQDESLETSSSPGPWPSGCPVDRSRSCPSS